MTEVEKQTGPTFGNDDDADRDRWPSRTAFYLAAIGSAVGFGNVWRFPALAKDYGGGAFFIPYIMALFLVGLPTIVLEIALGQYHQTGNVGVFGSFHKRFRGVGVSSIACAYILVIYYSELLTWVTKAFFDSFGDSDPWAKDGTTGEAAVDYFTGKIIGMSSLGSDNRPTRLLGSNVAWSLFVWIVVFCCLAFGMKWTGRVAYFSMGFPIFLLFVFLFRAITLEGSSDGIEAYIGKWDVAVLTEQPDVWSTAVSQIFFSLSVTMGTMTAYGSHCPRGEPAFINACVIGISNCMFSFIAGFAVFASLGHLAVLEQKDVNDIPYSGFSLVFGTWPVVLGTLSGGEHWVRLLFLNLFLLGVDSAFSILEGPVTVFYDWFGSETLPKWKITLVFSVVGFLLAIMYDTDAGLIWLDTIDFYINFVLLLVGFLQSFGAGWITGIEQQIEILGAPVVWVWMFTNFGSVLVASLLWFLLEDNAVLAGFIALFLSAAIGTAATVMLLQQNANEDMSFKDAAYELMLKNVMDFKAELSSVVGWIPDMWAWMMKLVIPHILLILFINLCLSDNGSGEPLFGNYGDYVKWPYQVLGILCVVFAASLALIGAVVPELFEGADLPYLEKMRNTEPSMGVEKDVEEAEEVEDEK